MSSFRNISAVLAGLGTISLIATHSTPAYAQNDFVGVISKLIERQRALRESRREEALAVKRMQLGLKALGYYDGAIDGDFGSGTQAALTEYRRLVGRSEFEGLSLEEVQEIENRASEASAVTEPKSDETAPPPAAKAKALVRADTPRRLDAALSDAAAWIVLASRETAEEALSVAEEYVRYFVSTTVIKSSNGRYAVVAGWLNKDLGRPLKDVLIARNLIPDDAFLSSGSKFGAPVWSVNGHLIHARTDLLNFSLIRPTADLLSQIGSSSASITTFASRVAAFPNASDYLSLRTGNSAASKEVRRLPEGTLLKVVRTQDGWLQVRLLNGMTGWVAANYVRQSGGQEEPSPRVAENTINRIDVAEQGRQANKTKESLEFLDDLAIYLRLHPETPDIATIAEEIAKLQQAIQENNFTAIDGTTQRLKRRMSDVSDFAEFIRGRIEERKEAELKALGEAVTLASKHKQFLRNQISENVTSPNITRFAGLLKQYELAWTQPELVILTDLNDRVKQLVSELELTASYDAAMAQLKPERPKESQQLHPTITNRNRFLMEGDLGDWVFLFNSSGKAPNVVRNIRGDIVFDNSTAKTCVLHPTQQIVEADDVEDLLAAQVKNVKFDSGRCPEADLQRYDVLIALRGEWLKQPPSYMAPLLGQIEDSRFQELETLTSAAFENRARNDKNEAARLENEIATGTRSGYGLVKIENGASSICFTTTEDGQDAQRAMLNDNRQVLLKLFASTPEMLSRTAEAAFRDAKRGACGAIYGERGDLWDVIQGLRRDNVSYSVVPLWFDSKLVAERAVQLRADQMSESQTVENKKRRIREAEELDERRKKAEGGEKSARELELRKQHGPQARARADEIFDEVKALVQGRDNEAGSAFPELASWYRERTADGWEYVSANRAITDFGTVDWKARPLEVVFTDVSIEMTNRRLGEKQTTCFTLGLIFDAEFQMHREPFLTKCGDKSSGQNWKQARGFKSDWVAQ